MICDFKLHPINNDTKKNPFTVYMVDRVNGEGTIQLKEDEPLLDCEIQKEYQFYVTAYDCGTGKDKHGKITHQRKSHKYAHSTDYTD